MKIDKLHWVFGAISQSAQELGLGCSGYYYFNHWRNMDGIEITESHLLFCLNKSKQEKISYHQPGSSTAWFHFPEINFVLALHCTKSPRAATRNKYREKFNSIYEASINSYRVAHNALTGWLAKDAFSEKLLLCLSKMAASSTVSDDTQESSLPKAVSVMALDIDYFKQVNDTWGHYYGDQVLKAFGQRPEEVAKRIEDSSEGEIDVFVGHPSGEEFLVVIFANAAKEQFTEWASLFRVKIADSFLPSDAEWTALTRHAPASATPPPLQERTVTTSIGVTQHTSVPRSGDRAKFAAELLERADTALYRAKAAGRNQVIFYDEILASCGKILEYDKATGVAALDIGKNVGVTVGQEFKVFPLHIQDKESSLLMTEEPHAHQGFILKSKADDLLSSTHNLKFHLPVYLRMTMALPHSKREPPWKPFQQEALDIYYLTSLDFSQRLMNQGEVMEFSPLKTTQTNQKSKENIHSRRYSASPRKVITARNMEQRL